MSPFTSISKKDLRDQVEKALTTSLEKLQEGISEKKFRKNIRKASKVMISGVKIGSKKKRVKLSKVADTPQTVTN